MKIVHICLCGPYNDGWSYQDNLIPNYNKLDGHDVTVITSRYIDNKESKGVDKVKSGEYTYDNINIIRLEKALLIPEVVNLKLRKYRKLYSHLEAIQPDLIFFHGIQSIEMLVVKKYIKNNSDCKWVVDNHASYYNSATNNFSKNIIHKLFYRSVISKSEKYIDQYFSITPECKKFMVDMYSINEKRIDDLYLGFDTILFEKILKKYSKKELRDIYDIDKDSVVLVTGGKLNKSKRIIQTIDIFNEINSSNSLLLIFGILSEDIEKEFLKKINENKRIKYLGWKNQNEINELLLLSDIGVYLGSQSALWQQSIGAGLPLVISVEENANYLDFGGNILFTNRNNKSETIEKVQEIINSKDLVEEMSMICETKAKKHFSYREISRKAILKDGK
ncbi:glycosyltransferase family 4 protein [Vagococcus fluvialis]|uniref:glycosyltransferase family 4 protein n=1 Tax=Vagococcus fluvialis TaxID=2738 RepID=UPI002B2839FC|nr:glycosyltransferase family 4 protein [Vagococcus fluvialis]